VTVDELTAELFRYAPQIAAGAAALAVPLALFAWRSAVGLRGETERLRLLAEQGLAGQRGEAEFLRASLAATERALLAAFQSGQAEGMGRALSGIRDATSAVGATSDRLRHELTGILADQRTLLERRLREMREGNEAKLAEIQRSVNEQLAQAVEQQMTASFARVVDQFTSVQKAMGDVQAVASQIGDIKRLFANVKTRGGWGEAQVRAMLDDVLPPGAYEVNWQPRADAADRVEFAVIMPARGGGGPRLPVDAKFPVEDYERLLLAAEAGDLEGERAARRGLERRMREEARRIGGKYIVPPATVDFAIMYLPTDGLYAEVARVPGLIDEIGRLHRVLILGPTLFPAMLRTIHLGHVTLALEQKAEHVRVLLGATRTEMLKMDAVLDRLGKQAGTFATTIDAARTRTRAVGRTLRGVEALDPGAAERLLGVAGEEAAADGE
jgi:DNA recombination protein RmuC